MTKHSYGCMIDATKIPRSIPVYVLPFPEDFCLPWKSFPPTHTQLMRLCYSLLQFSLYIFCVDLSDLYPTPANLFLLLVYC